MTSKEVLTELFNEANRLPFEEPKYATHELWEMCRIIQNDLEVLELLHQRIKPDIFGRLCYVPILEERNGVYQDFESEKIWEWLKDEKIYSKGSIS